MADLVRLGAYRAGSDPAVDEAVTLAPRIDAMLRQGRKVICPPPAGFAQLATALEVP
jgi:flagellum-specific ATP synthase